MKVRFFFPILLLVLWACGSEPKLDLKPLNLLSYGIPLTIMAPDSADIKKENWTSLQGVSVRKGQDYDIQVWSGEASSTDVATVKASNMADIRDKRYFSRIVEEDDNGFIFETQIDSSATYYGFRYFVVQGDRELTIQNGLAGNFTLEQIEQMYEAVTAQPGKK